MKQEALVSQSRAAEPGVNRMRTSNTADEPLQSSARKVYDTMSEQLPIDDRHNTANHLDRHASSLDTAE